MKSPVVERPSGKAIYTSGKFCTLEPLSILTNNNCREVTRHNGGTTCRKIKFIWMHLKPRLTLTIFNVHTTFAKQTSRKNDVRINELYFFAWVPNCVCKHQLFSIILFKINYSLFYKWANLGPFSFSSSFQTNITNFITNRYVKKCPSSIKSQDCYLYFAKSV